MDADNAPVKPASPRDSAAAKPSGVGDARLLPYQYELPSDRIARFPAARREDARLLVLSGDRLSGDSLEDASVASLPTRLSPGDLIVVNDTRVIPARLALRRPSGARVEALLLGAGPGPVEALLRPGRRVRVGEKLAVLVEDEELPDAWIRPRALLPDGRWVVEVSPDPEAVMAAAGQMPIPPYLGRAAEPSDRERYQTVFAGPPGAVAAPTAGLHWTADLLDAVTARGVGLARITLQVGPGTFQNLRSEDLDRGTLHAEAYEISEQTVAALARTRAAGGRVLAVGTTTTRALESAADAEGQVRAGPGRTELFIREGYRFRVVDRLLTNFHLPASSLLLLVCAFGGRERVMAAYRHAVAKGYRFYSYGDAMLLDLAVSGAPS